MYHYTLEPSTEKFEASDEKIIKLVQDCKHLTRDEWKKTIEPGDIIIPYPKMSKVLLHFRIIGKINQLIQGSSFTSCKMVGRDAKSIIGYGAVLNTMGISSVSLDTFLNDHEISLIIRHKSATKEKMDRVLDLMYEHKKNKTSYDALGLVTSTLHHWLGDKDVKEKDETFMNDSKRALICSTIIYKCYKEAGLNISHTNEVGAAWLWPKDILLSSSMKVAGGYFSRDAKVPDPSDLKKIADSVKKPAE